MAYQRDTAILVLVLFVTLIGCVDDADSRGEFDDTAVATNDTEVDGHGASERDADVVDAAYEEHSIESYFETVAGTGDATRCEPEQPASLQDEECHVDSACPDGSVCRNRRTFGLQSQCECMESAACVVGDDATCGPGSVCLPGTSASSQLCGGALGTSLCVNTCLLGSCTSDSDCGSGEVCLLVRDRCREIQGTVCQPSAGQGCIGVAGGCAENEVCLLTMDDGWQCTADPGACD